jgi:transposase
LRSNTAAARAWGVLCSHCGTDKGDRNGAFPGGKSGDRPIAQTARDLGVNENTLHTWIKKYHRAKGVEKPVNEDPLYEELKRLKKENARLKEEREILKKAAAYFAKESP